MWGEKNKEISLVQQEFKYFDSVCVCFTANQTKLYLTCSNIWTRYLSRSGMVRGGEACEGLPSLDTVEASQRISHNLSQVSTVCSSGWWRLGPDGTELQQRCSQNVDISFAISWRSCSGGSSNVLSPGKAIPPSLRPTITAVFIPFLFVLVRISYFVSGCCSPHAQQRQHWKLSFPLDFLKKLKKLSKECVSVRRISVCSDRHACFPPRIQI